MTSLNDLPQGRQMSDEPGMAEFMFDIGKYFQPGFFPLQMWLQV